MLMRKFVCAVLFLVGLSGLSFAKGTSKPAVTPKAGVTSEQQADRYLIPGMVEDLYAMLPKKKTWEKFHWGLEERIRQEYYKNALFLSKHEENRNYFRFRTRMWFKADPWKWFSAYLRLTNECRAWMQHNPHDADMDEIFFDNIYVDIKRPFDLPVSVRFGRQDFIYGKGFVLFDGTPLDGSRSNYTDGIKATLHLDDLKTNIDALIMENNRHDRKFFRFNPTHHAMLEDESRMFGYYITSKYFDDIKLEQYYLYKAANGQPLSGNNYSQNEKLHTFGGKISGTLLKDFEYDSELAVQFGKDGREHRRGLGAYVTGKYNIPVTSLKPWVMAGYFYTSGDDPDTDRIEAWDPLNGRWPGQHDAEILLLTRATEDGVAYVTNTHKLRIGTGFCPVPWWSISLFYDHLEADECPKIYNRGRLFGDGKVRGEMFQGISKWNLAKNVSAYVKYEVMAPGSYYYDSADTAMFLKWELNIKY